MAEMHQRIKEALEFALESPVLQLGEHGLESDTGLFKIGDGVTRWNSLDYYGGEGVGTGPGTGTGPAPGPGPGPAPLSESIVVANHGNDFDFPRPDGLVVYWLGGAEPDNAMENDLWSEGGDLL